MADDYTPTTERVRQRWLEAYEYERDMPGRIRRRYPVEVLAQFDRWLAAHDAEKRAEWEAERGRRAVIDVETQVDLKKMFPEPVNPEKPEDTV